MGNRRVALFFDVDGTLIDTGGAGAASWRMAFDELYGIPADIGKFTDNGMTDPDVGRRTFVAELGRQPSDQEFDTLLARRLHFLRTTVAESTGYRVLDGVTSLLPRLLHEGYLLGLVTGNLESAAHVKLARAHLNGYFCFGGYGSDDVDRGAIVRVAQRRASLVYGDDLTAASCLVIGDTPHDVEGAHAAGLECVGVASHHYNAEQLRAGGADFVLTSLEEALPL